MPALSTVLRRAAMLLGMTLALFALVAYAAWPIGTVLHPELRASFAAQPAELLKLHVFAAALALLLGPAQLSARLRAARPGLHRWLGRLYLGVGVGIGGLTGAVLALQAHGGAWARAGFLALALAWLATGALAWRAARSGAITAHRRWMLANLGLSFAAVALRLWLPLLLAAGVPLAVAYPLVAWLCWLPQAVLVAWCWQRAVAPGASRAVLRRWAAGTLALLAGCGAVQPARLALPDGLAAADATIELRGLGAGTRGRTDVLGRPLVFERRADRLALFDALAVSERAALHWRWGEGEALQGDCRSRRRTHGVGVVEFVGRPLEIRCRFDPGGSQLVLTETRASTQGLGGGRQGELQAGAERWTVRSLHRAQGAAFDVAQPLGYVIEAGGRAVAAVELQGTRPRLHLPPAGDPRRDQVLPALLSLALLWDGGAP